MTLSRTVSRANSAATIRHGPAARFDVSSNIAGIVTSEHASQTVCYIVVYNLDLLGMLGDFYFEVFVCFHGALQGHNFPCDDF